MKRTVFSELLKTNKWNIQNIQKNPNIFHKNQDCLSDHYSGRAKPYEIIWFCTTRMKLFLKLDCSGAKLFSLAPALLLYAKKQKKWKISDFEKKIWNYEKTNGGSLKRPLLDFVGYELTNGGPMKRS